MTVGQPDINLNTWGITYEVIEKDLESLAAGARPSPKKTKPKKEKKVLPKKERARKIEKDPEEEAGDKERREHKEAVREVKEGDPAKRKEIHDKYHMEDLKERTDEKRRGKENPKYTKYHSYDEDAPDAVVQGQATRDTGGHAVTQEAIERKREKEQKTRRDSKYLGRKTNPDKTREYKEEKQYKQRDEPVLDSKNPKAAQAVRETQHIGNRKVKIPRHADAGDKAGHIGSPDVVPSKIISADEVKRRAQASFPNPQAKDRPKDRVDTPVKDTREYVTQSAQKTLNGLSSLRIGLAKAEEEEAYKKFQSRLKDPSHGTLSGVSSGGGEGAVTQDKKSPLNRPVKTQVTPSGKRSGLNKPAYVPERYNKKPQGEGATGDIQAASQAKDISAEVRANVKRIKQERAGRTSQHRETRQRASYDTGDEKVPDKVVKPELHGQKGRQYLQGEGAKEEWEKSQGRGQKYAKIPPKQSKSGHSEEYQTKRTMYLAGMSRQKRVAFNKLSAEEQRKKITFGTRPQSQKKKKSLLEIKADLDKSFAAESARTRKEGVEEGERPTQDNPFPKTKTPKGNKAPTGVGKPRHGGHGYRTGNASRFNTSISDGSKRGSKKSLLEIKADLDGLVNKFTVTEVGETQGDGKCVNCGRDHKAANQKLDDDYNKRTGGKGMTRMYAGGCPTCGRHVGYSARKYGGGNNQGKKFHGMTGKRIRDTGAADYDPKVHASSKD